ncbi:similar to An07g09782 [Aspergillus luchuensis IFO 4308]|nr:similar to An07g09782 [Aspergillus luchuensis IFO 4308]
MASSKKKRNQSKSKPSSSKRRKVVETAPEAPDQSEEAVPQPTVSFQAQPVSPVDSLSSNVSFKLHQRLERFDDLEPSGIIVDVKPPDDIKEYADSTVLGSKKLRMVEQSKVVEAFMAKIAELSRRNNMKHEWVGLIHNAILHMNLENRVAFRTVEDKEHRSRPDICVGLSESHLREILYKDPDDAAAKEFWNNLKEKDGVLSDPYAKPQYLRFPFFIVEVRADFNGDNLHQAQNRAAVGAAGALWMLQMLSDNRRETKSAKSKKGFDITNLPVFSLVSEGATFQLWVHYRKMVPGNSTDKIEYCSAHVKSWHANGEKACYKILRNIYAILRWGVGEFKNKVVEALKSYV